MQFTTHNTAETLQLGVNLGQHLNKGDIVLLFGDLGAGKTLLTQGIARGLGLKDNEYIRSPTFTIINEYKANCPIYHIDLYRLNTFLEIENLGLEELFSDNGVTIVEWAEKLFQIPGDPKSIGLGIFERIEVKIDIVGDNNRHYEIYCIPSDKSHPIFSLQ